MTTIDLSDKQLEDVRRAMLNSTVRDLEWVAKDLDRLATHAPWPVDSASSDAQNAVKMARESLDLLDALGWPRDEPRFESERKAQSPAALHEVPA